MASSLSIPSSSSLNSNKPINNNKSLPASWHLLSGAISGSTSVLALQPLDLIKTRIQQDNKAIKSLSSSSNAKLDLSKTKTTTIKDPKIISTIKGVIKLDGVRGLWRGTTPTLYRNVPGVSLYFLTLSKLRTIIGSTNSSYFVAPSSLLAASPSAALLSATAGTTSKVANGGGKIKLTTAGDLLVGSTARTGVGFLLMPFTLLKTLSESSLSLSTPSSTATTTASTSTSSLSTLSTLYKSGGLKSLWRGAVPTALRDAPGAGLFIVFYERGRSLLGVRGDGGGGAIGGGMAGATASLLSTLLTTPFDLLKTRRQLSPTTYTSLTQSIALVYNQGGLKSFWEGGGLRVVRKAGSAGIGWAVYERCQSFFWERSKKEVGRD